MTELKDAIEKRVQNISRSFKFGGREISPSVFISPMAGVTDNPFRRMVMDISGQKPGLFVSEFVSVDGMTRLIPAVCRHMRFEEDQRPVCIQIFGSNPESMERGARMVAEFGADFVEINAGCPAPKIVKKSGGSGLLRNLPLFRQIVSRVVAAAGIPVSVKVRTGYTASEINVEETHRIAEGEGVSLFVIHGRTREQGYKGLADWDLIGKIKSVSSIPIIGNGDIVTLEDVVEKLETYGVDGVSVGRGAMHNPWLFGQVGDLFQSNPPRLPGVDDHISLFEKYSGFLYDEYGNWNTVLGRLKQLAARLVKGWPDCARWRSLMLRSQSAEEFFEHLRLFYGGLADMQRQMGVIMELNGRGEDRIDFGLQFKK